MLTRAAKGYPRRDRRGFVIVHTSLNISRPRVTALTLPTQSYGAVTLFDTETAVSESQQAPLLGLGHKLPRLGKKLLESGFQLTVVHIDARTEALLAVLGTAPADVVICNTVAVVEEIRQGYSLSEGRQCGVGKGSEGRLC